MTATASPVKTRWRDPEGGPDRSQFHTVRSVTPKRLAVARTEHTGTRPPLSADVRRSRASAASIATGSEAALTERPVLERDQPPRPARCGWTAVHRGDSAPARGPR